MKNKLTILEIAKLANVGKSTVSRFLNGGYVSSENAEKIDKIIQEYNYKPNVFARGIKAKNNSFIGIVVPCLDSFITSHILMQLDSNLRKNGYVPLIMNTDHNINLELESFENLMRLRVEGIIFFSTIITEKHREFFNKTTIPLLVIGQQYQGVTYITNDDFLAGKKIGEYIGKLGHQSVVYLGVSEEDKAVGVIRKNGVIEGLKNYDCKKIECLETDFSMEKSEEVLEKYLIKNRPTCVICATDNIAFGAINAIKKANLSIPEDISVCGFGGYKISELLTPSLTTIRFNYQKIGDLATNMIIKLINQDGYFEEKLVDFEFIEGKSVKKLSI